MKCIQTAIPEVLILEPTVYQDDRGWFMESFHQEKFYEAFKQLGLAIPKPFVQDNHSLSKKQVLRGLHYQLPPFAQGKLVRVVQGAAYDVAVDIRPQSPTFGQWVGLELSASNNKMLWIPEGFAHGFLTLEDDTHFLYKTTDVYHKESEVSIRWDDPDLAIEWPLQDMPILNDKDKIAPFFKEAININPISHQPRCARLFDLDVIGDERGSLVVFEQGCNVPFDIKRAYYIFGNQLEVSRGFHAHQTLQQVAICVAGKCRMVLDNGHKRESFWLDSPSKALFINHMMWREMHDFSQDCVLLVFASQYYDENDYIRDYEEFLHRVGRFVPTFELKPIV